MQLSQQEQQLCLLLRDLPREYGNRYDEAAANHLVEALFRSLVGDREDYLESLFPLGLPEPSVRWSLRKAQGAVDGAEYTEAARGHRCGHILKPGEATYRCRTCSQDDTCVLCSKCFEASDHDGHMVYVSVSPGNSGCCDCGDPEAWLRPVYCTIHSEIEEREGLTEPKGKAVSLLPMDLRESIRMTITKALDYFCDVWSCSPEQLRLPKTEASVKDDERNSRLSSDWYGTEDVEEPIEYALVLWNDEKHTVNEVKDIVARACRLSRRQGLIQAHQVDDIGRSVVIYNTDLPLLLAMAKIIEQPKLTVTIRSARDTFRESMCETIIEWILDIAGCSVGPDKDILRSTICEELLSAWRVGSAAHHKVIGKDGIDDHEIEDMADEYLQWFGRTPARLRRARRPQQPSQDNPHSIAENSDETDENVDEDVDMMDVDEESGNSGDRDDTDVMDELDDALEASEATIAGYPPPPPPPSGPYRRHRISGVLSGDSDDGEVVGPQMLVPKTPMANPKVGRHPVPPRYWLDRPTGYFRRHGIPLCEDLWQRVRLDFFILYDLRMWKKLRTQIRDVLISTVVNSSFFKRMLGLRFAGVYTVLAELYLIADREPDHSIINLSLQMLTTPTITAEVIERGNFLTNLMAILYTFLTTRQVGYPFDVNLSATLAFDQGTVTNRRTHQFYHDMQYLLASDLVQERIRSEERYLLQFLDLVKLHQGICPNVRAVGEHLEYEADAWIQAQMVTTEIMKLCRKFTDSFYVQLPQDPTDLSRAIRNTAKFTTINSLGAERRRFTQSEIKSEVRFKQVGPFEFEQSLQDRGRPYTIVKFSVADEPMSFHHPLHYTLSWLIDRGKSFSPDTIRRLLLFSTQELRQPPTPQKAQIPELDPEQNLYALLDFPIRICAWLAQMRANMWVRNGITLRHQMQTYRIFSRSSLSYQRDIFLIQTAMVICPPATVLATIIDRFDVMDWVKGEFLLKAAEDEQPKLDIAEDFIHLLIILLSDRVYLRSLEEDKSPQLSISRRDIIHALCFKPMAFSELDSKMSEKISDSFEFHELLKEMTTYRPPDGMTDTGTFALKEQYLEEIDPYLAYFSRNQRDEAETVYKKYIAKQRGKDPSDVYFEPKLITLGSGLFSNLAAFTRTPLFAQVVCYFLQFASNYDTTQTRIPLTKVEQFLSFVVHLILLAVLEDKAENDGTMLQDQASFCHLALTKHGRSVSGGPMTIVGILRLIAEKESFKSCHPKIHGILQHIRHKRPAEYAAWMTSMNLPVDRSNAGSPASTAALERELKKKQALERQARVMAQMKQQQANFLQNQMAWGEEDFSDLEEEESSSPSEGAEKVWKYPTGTCILCQEETNNEKLFGTFSFITTSGIFRTTDVMDVDWVQEVVDTPSSLDRSAEAIRPFGVAGKNKRTVQKVGADGRVIEIERQELSKSWPSTEVRHGPVATGCGHIMHFSCFEIFLVATQRRHITQVSRNHPERIELKQFLCPLCKALGNAFLPILWKGKELKSPSALEPLQNFEQYMLSEIPKLQEALESVEGPQELERIVEQKNPPFRSPEQYFLDYGNEKLVSSIADQLFHLTRPTTTYSMNPQAQSHRNPLIPGWPSFVQFSQEETFTWSTTSANEVTNVTIPPQLLELVKIYQRLRETMRVNYLGSLYSVPANTPDDLVFTDTLIKTLAGSIVATEIAQRGVEAAPGCTLLGTMSTQQITHLRVLSETVSTYMAIGGLRSGGANSTRREFLDMQLKQLQRLFGAVPVGQHQVSYEAAPLLAEDAFMFFTELSAVAIPCLKLDVHHMMRLCYMAELTRVIFLYSTFLTEMPTYSAAHPQPNEGFVRRLKNWPYPPSNVSFKALLEEEGMPTLVRIIESYALPFLRKCIILMNVRYGVEFPPDSTATQEESELSRLSRLLRLPLPIDLIAEQFEGSIADNCVSAWVEHWHWSGTGNSRHNAVEGPRPLVTISHPAIYELIGLPKMFSTLQDEVMKRRCPTTGKDLADPCLCLFCGEFFCGQAICCASEDNLGGAQQHRMKCGGITGMFINVRKCIVVLLHGMSGSFFPAPYLDQYGEIDMSLRRKHQLFLNQRRYDKLLRELWLNHGVPSQIARKMEADTNTGGWETL